MCLTTILGHDVQKIHNLMGKCSNKFHNSVYGGLLDGAHSGNDDPPPPPPVQFFETYMMIM